jgi:protein arginine kinase activator
MAEKLCESCSKAPATRQRTQVIGGQKTTQAVCDPCWESNYLIDPDQIAQQTTFQVPSVGAIVAIPLPSSGALPVQPKDLGTCPGCGLTWAGFRENSRFGCARCYETFSDGIEEILDRLHGGHVHQGRIPESVLDRQTRRLRRLELRSQLDEAIQSEDYEWAARLRDALRTLEAEKDPTRGVG